MKAKFAKRLLSFFTVLAMIFALSDLLMIDLGIAASAENASVEIEGFGVTITGDTSTYTVTDKNGGKGKNITVTESGAELTFSGSTNYLLIIVPSGVTDVTITLDNYSANIPGSEWGWSPISLISGSSATVILKDGTVNKLYGSSESSAIRVEKGASLTINGNGTLNAGVNNWGAARCAVIGSGYNANYGDITILGGMLNINETINYRNAAIGTAYWTYEGTDNGFITLAGGTINTSGSIGATSRGKNQNNNVVIAGTVIFGNTMSIRANTNTYYSCDVIYECDGVTVSTTGKAITNDKSKSNGTVRVHIMSSQTFDWSDDYSSAAVTLTCSKCGHVEENITATVKSKVTTEQSCEDDEITTYTATAEYENVPYTEQKNVKTADKTGHTFGEWETTTPATETAEGVKTRKCTVCEYVETESVDKLTHEADTSEWLSDESTHWHKCLNDNCEEKLDEEAHTFGEWEITTPAAETSEGVKTRKCTVCEYVETESVDKLTHEADTSEWLSDENSHWNKCLNDNCEEKLNKAEHTYGEWIISKEPTFTEKGEKYRECTVCGYRVTEEVESKEQELFVAANVRSKSYIYVYDTDMDLIKVFKTKKNADTIKVNLSDKYAGKTVRLYIGKKSTTGDYTEYILDENGDVTIEVDERTNYTLALA